MNKNICLRCHRHAENDDRPESWWCAQRLSLLPSAVVPNHSCYVRDYFVPITNQTQNPPLWCEFLMEQSITTPADNVPAPVHMTDLIYTGGGTCEEGKSNPEKIERSHHRRHAYWPSWRIGNNNFVIENKYIYSPALGILDEEFEESVKEGVEKGLSVVRKLKGNKDE